jgi:sterol desaturase/sphingolipid hydroxylase (fatty acid hydroxylase superfamily)
MKFVKITFDDLRSSLGDFGPQRLAKLGLGSTNYWLTFISDPLTVVFFIFWEIFILRSRPWLVAITFFTGLVTWTFVEYAFHRWVYHKGRTAAHAGHMVHHDAPETLIAMPWFVVTAAFGGLWYLTTRFAPAHHVLSVAAGILLGFVLYGVFHHVLHRFEFQSRWYRRLRAHHVIHHHFPNVNFGVTSRFWDLMLRTSHHNRSRRAPSR